MLVASFGVLLVFPATATAGVPAVYFTGARDEALVGAPPEEGEITVPWFDRVQIRGAADDSDQERRAYAARLSIKTPTQYLAEKEILNLRANRGVATARVALSAALRQRYRLLIDLHHRQLQSRLAEAQRRLAQRTVDALRAVAGTGEFRPGALQQAELRLTVAYQNTRLAERRWRRTRRRFNAFLPAGHESAAVTSGEVELGELLDVDNVSSWLRGADETDDAHHNAAVNLARLDANLAREEQERERGRSGFGLRFLEVRHDSENGNADGDYRLTIGIDMPLGRSFASSERHLRRNEAEYRMHRLHRAQRREREQIDDELDLLIGEYRIHHERLDDIDTRLARYNRSTPATLTLELQRERLDSRGRLIALQADICQRYIDTLHLRGLLAAEPLRNWLVVGRPRL
jgi:hypothetical protein